MIILHPLGWLNRQQKKRIVLPVLLIMIAVMISLGIIDEVLKNAVAPLGIVSFELAKDTATAQAILKSWGSEGQVYAGLTLGLDFLYIFIYTLLLILLADLVSDSWDIRWSLPVPFATVMAWFLVMAGLCDGIEDLALITQLLHGPRDPWPLLALWFASLKFAFLTVAILYILLAGSLVITAHWKRQTLFRPKRG